MNQHDMTDLNDDEKKLIHDLLSEDDALLSPAGIQRRYFLKQLLGIGGGLIAGQLIGEQNVFANTPGNWDTLPPGMLQNPVKIDFKVNGLTKKLEVDSRMTLLDALRERLQLTGSKKGCDHGQCGACTVIVNGQRVLSCLTLAATCTGKTVETIEGFAKDGKLHPMQAAFIKHDGFQCGFCTPGQICSGVALADEVKQGQASYITDPINALADSPGLSDDEIRERMSGNLCRCGAYANIVSAIREVLSGKDVVQQWPMIPGVPAPAQTSTSTPLNN